jgi:TolB protein
MKKFVVTSWLCFLLIQVFAREQNLLIKAQTPVQTKVLILCDKHKVGDTNKRLVHTLKKDLSFSGQLNVDVAVVGQKNKDIEFICSFSSRGYNIVAFATTFNNIIDICLCETITGSSIFKKTYSIKDDAVVACAHMVANDIWQTLLNQSGLFTTKIAYSQDGDVLNGVCTKQIYVADYDGNNARCVVPKDGVCIAPRWHIDTKNASLFYSDCVEKNIRLMLLDSSLNVSLASNFTGMNMLPTFFPSGNAMVYCLSAAQGECKLYIYKKDNLKQLQLGKGNCFSPTVGNAGQTLYYCWDGRVGYPEIYAYDFKKREKRRISSEGYCVTPSFSDERQQLAYSKGIKGTLQLFIYDEKTKTHTQLTSGVGNKQEPSWSPCGNYLLFSYSTKNSSRIALLNMITQQKQFVTSENVRCGYPSWSPQYDDPYLFS